MDKALDKHVNFRMDAKEHAKLVEIADRYKLPVGELIRLAISDNLMRIAEINHERRSNYLAEDRKEIIRNQLALLGIVSSAKSELRYIGNNLNQLAKKANSGEQVSSFDLLPLAGQFDDVVAELERTREGVNKIWQLLE